MRSLQSIESWMMHVITNPHGVHAGAQDFEAQHRLDVPSAQLDQVVIESPNWSATDRLGVYWNAYYSRLEECLRDEFPILRATVGDELFDDFAFDYLQAYPPAGYTLAKLGAKFPEFLVRTRPTREDEEAPPDWADFIAELAHFEWTISEVFDGPGIESLRTPTNSSDDIPAEHPDAATFTCPPCLRLVAYQSPVPSFHSMVKAGGTTDVPPSAKSYVAVTRQNYTVKHYSLGVNEFHLLRLLQAGHSLGAALDAICHSDSIAEEVETHVALWFAEWTRAGFIRRADRMNS